MDRFDKFLDFAEKLGCKCLKNELMSKHTTFKIGGPADCFVAVNNYENLTKIIKYCKREDLSLSVVGNGSNLLVSDKGIEGIVAKIDCENDIILSDDNVICCNAGVKLSTLCKFALDNSLTGLEFAWGIPGTIGGAVYMNAGAYGSEIKNVIHSCESIDKNGNERQYDTSEMELGYRNSIFKSNGEIITKAFFKLEKGKAKAIKEKMDDLMNRRKSNQPVEYPSAGSVFKRPEGNFAGTLIEQCGLKGKSFGGAEVSKKHAGFIINIGGATCEDVLKLVDFIKQTVFEKTGVKLEQEIAVVGR